MSNTITTKESASLYSAVGTNQEHGTSTRRQALLALRSALRLLVTLVAFAGMPASPLHAQETSVSQLPGVYRFIVAWWWVAA